MSAFTAQTLDLSRLPAPSLVDADYAARLAARLAHLAQVWAEHRALVPTFREPELTIASSTEVILSEDYAFGDMLLRQAVNDAAGGLRLATASGADLDHLAATYHRTLRATLVPADPVTGAAAVMEGDDALRERAQLAPEGLAAFGLTPGGYLAAVRGAFAPSIKHVVAIHRGAGRVELRVLGRAGDGTVAPATIAAIAAAFRGEDGSQTTDVLTVLPAEIRPVAADLTLVLPKGPDPEAVKVGARSRLAALGASLHRLGAPVFREALASAAHVGPAITVRVNAPAADWPGAPEVAPYLAASAIALDHEVA